MDKMKYVARAALAVGLLVAFYVLALGIAVALVVALVAVLRLGFRGLLVAQLFALVVPVVFAVLYGVFGRSRDGGPPGVLLTEQAQPRLWAMARELADLAETRCADEIRLVAEVNAAVSDSGSWLGLRAGTRRLYVGVPLLLAFDEAQLRSVLAHEFGHYGGRHTTFAGVSYRGAETIRRTLDQLGTRHFASRVFLLYARLYFAVSHTVNRRQELEADQLSARAVGPEVAASTLLELAPLAVAWQGYLGRFATMGRELDRRPTGVLTGFSDHLARPEVARGMQEVRDAAPEEETTSVFDTHPSTSQRVALLLGGAAPAPWQSGGPALGLLTAPEVPFAELEDSLYDESGRTPTPLPELARLAGADQLARHSAALDRVLKEQGRPPGLGTVYQALGNGTAARLLRPLVPDDQVDLPKVTARLLADYLGAALLAADQARVELDWASGWTVVDPAGARLDLVELVEEVLANPSLAGDLHELMRLSGISDSWRPAQVVEDRTPKGPARVRGVISPVNVAKTLVVTDSGLLWLTQSWGDRFAIASRMNGKEADRLFQRYAGMSPDEVARTRRARVIPWAAIAEARVAPRPWGRIWIVVAVAGGAPLVVKVQKNSQEAGQPWASLAHYLDERFVAQMRMPTRV
jgi:Zn-dependent protease with chaperone function